MSYNTLLTIIISFLFVPLATAQQDTLITIGSTSLVGEIKEMDLGVITIETSFSDEDFKIEWLKVKQIASAQTFMFTTSDGHRYYGTIRKSLTSDTLIIDDIEMGFIPVQAREIVYIKQIKQGKMLDNINLSMDIGYSFTKSNNLHQLNGSLAGDYMTQIWGVNTYATTVRSAQDNVTTTNRDNAGIGLKLFFANDFFGNVATDFYSSNEQQMDLRSNYNVGIGRYFVHTNKIYFNSTVGVGFTVENYTDSTNARRSTEGVVKLEYNMFDMGDLNLLTNVSIFPGFTEAGRWRTSLNLQLKYDLPRDFYIKTSLDYNYDSKPIDGVAGNDYVITGGIGWEL